MQRLHAKPQCWTTQTTEFAHGSKAAGLYTETKPTVHGRLCGWPLVGERLQKLLIPRDQFEHRRGELLHANTHSQQGGDR